jgi:hypothetical protein
MWLLVSIPVVPPLLATGMPSPDDRAGSGVPHCTSDDGTACRTPSFASIGLPISRTLAVLLLLVLLRLLLVLLWLGLLLLGLRLGLR